MNRQNESSGPLTGWRVLITRPAEQSSGLRALIERAGGEPELFPLIVIEPSAAAERAREMLERPERWDWIVFVSANAVRYACRLGDRWRNPPGQVRLAAIGPGTAESLRSIGLTVDLTPKAQFNSEALLDSTELQDLEGAKILIVRGSGGRELIADTLRARGAAVEYAEVYRRVPPSVDASPLIAGWERGEVDALTLTSSEALRNLVTLLGPDHVDLVRWTPLAVIGERIAARAKQLGCRTIDVASEASDEGLCSALVRLAHSR